MRHGGGLDISTSELQSIYNTSEIGAGDNGAPPESGGMSVTKLRAGPFFLLPRSPFTPYHRIMPPRRSLPGPSGPSTPLNKIVRGENTRPASARPASPATPLNAETSSRATRSTRSARTTRSSSSTPQPTRGRRASHGGRDGKDFEFGSGEHPHHHMTADELTLLEGREILEDMAPGSARAQRHAHLTAARRAREAEEREVTKESEGETEESMTATGETIDGSETDEGHVAALVGEHLPVEEASSVSDADAEVEGSEDGDGTEKENGGDPQNGASSSEDDSDSDSESDSNSDSDSDSESDSDSGSDSDVSKDSDEDEQRLEKLLQAAKISAAAQASRAVSSEEKDDGEVVLQFDEQEKKEAWVAFQSCGKAKRLWLTPAPSLIFLLAGCHNHSCRLMPTALQGLLRLLPSCRHQHSLLPKLLPRARARRRHLSWSLTTDHTNGN